MTGISPEDWMGSDVLVEIVGSVDYQVVARLDGISTMGAVLTGADPSGEPVFFPWGRISSVRPAREEDYGSPRP